MIDPDFFDKVEAIARYVRKSDKPFGGIQVKIFLILQLYFCIFFKLFINTIFIIFEILRL